MAEIQKIGPTGEPTSLIKWFKHTYWEAEQAVILLVGLDPAGTVFRQSKNEFGHPIITLDCAVFLDETEIDCRKFDQGSEEQKQVYAIEKAYVQLHDIMTSDFMPAMEPSWFVEWARTKDISVPWRQWADDKALIKQVGKRSGESEPEAPKALGTRERETVTRIIAGFLAQGFSPAEISRPYSVAREIQQALQSAAIDLSDDTIAKWIKDAAALLPGDNKFTD